MVDGQGGTVTSADGMATLVIPAGALPAATSITLGLTVFGLDASLVQRTDYAVGPSTVTFAVPATLTIRFDPRRAPPGVDLGALQLVRRFPLPLAGAAGSAVDAAAPAASGTITGAGTYAVRWPGPTGPCTSAYHGLFDFWIGTWNARANGSPIGGINVITKDASGCLIHENWAGGQGRSISYVGNDGAWYQNYVSTGGSNQIPMRGGPDGDRLLLYTDNGSRFWWQPTNAGRVVRYVTEQTNDGGASWSVVADWEYYR